jgi:hypothetical protein
MKNTKHYSLGALIAKRELEFVNDNRLKRILIKIGKPRIDKIATDGYYCPFIILGIGKERVQVAFGVDSVQAIELALEMIGAIMTLYYQRLNPSKITWNGGSWLGFPLSDTREEMLKKERQWFRKMKINKK